MTRTPDSRLLQLVFPGLGAAKSPLAPRKRASPSARPSRPRPRTRTIKHASPRASHALLLQRPVYPSGRLQAIAYILHSSPAPVLVQARTPTHLTSR